METIAKYGKDRRLEANKKYKSTHQLIMIE